MAFGKDIERLARSLHGQRLERLYIKHYLMEVFQLDDETVEAVLMKVGIVEKVEKGKTPSKTANDTKPVNRQSFY